VEIRDIMAAAKNGTSPPTSPIGRMDVTYGTPGYGGLLTEWAEQVPDLLVTHVA
jgi:hypothetical protein